MEVTTWLYNDGGNPSTYEDSSSEKQSTSETSSFTIDDTLVSPKSHSFITSLKTLTPQINHLAIQNNILYAASLDEISVFDLKTYQLINKFSDAAKSIVFRNRKIFTSHQDCKIRVWQLTPTKKYNHLSTLPTLKDRLRRSISPKNYVQIRRHKQKIWIQHADTVSALAVNDGLMYSVSWDKTLKIWRMSDFSCLESVKGHADAVNAVVVSHDGVVYSASADGEIKVWKKGKNKKHNLVCTLKKHKSSVNALALNKEGSVLFSGGYDENILVWEMEKCVFLSDTDATTNLANTWTLKGHKGAILCLNYIDDVLISGSSDKGVRVWGKNRECGYFCCIVLEGHCKPVKSITTAWDDDVNGENGGVLSVFSGSLDGEIRVWKIIVSNLD